MSEQRPWAPGAPGPRGRPDDPWGFGGVLPAPRPGAVPLRPLGLGEILDGAMQVLRAHPRLTIGTAAILAVVTQAILIPLNASVGSDAFSTLTSRTPTTLTDAAGLLSVGGTLLSVQFVVTVFVTSLLTGMFSIVVSRAVLGAPVEARGWWRAARGRIPGLLGLGATVLLLLLAVAAVCALPAVLVGVLSGSGALAVPLGFLGFLVMAAGWLALLTLISFAAPTYALEGVGLRAALQRSRRLVRPDFWRVLGILLLARLIAYLAASIVSVPFGLLGSAAAGVGANPYTFFPLLLAAIGGIIGAAIAIPFRTAVTGVLYVDQRMRREGFDLELRRAAQASS